jgi:tRNA threonylcarbamoyladenosine biosynthesis protein TsaB
VILLGFDTSTSATTVGLRLADGTVLEARDDPRAGGHPGHATRLLELAGGLLNGAGIDWRALDRIAVGLGPGTFTGLRVGVASARGLAHSLAVELVGVSSLQALAHGALTVLGDPDAVILAMIDARRGEAFAAAYLSGRELSAPRALGPEALSDCLQALRGHGRVLAVGDGALRFGDELRRAGGFLAGDDSPAHLISAEAICDLGVRAPIADPQLILPDYRRRADAEIALESADK